DSRTNNLVQETSFVQPTPQVPFVQPRPQTPSVQQQPQAPFDQRQLQTSFNQRQPQTSFEQPQTQTVFSQRQPQTPFTPEPTAFTQARSDWKAIKKNKTCTHLEIVAAEPSTTRMKTIIPLT
ncbi:hypothetical protein OSTOST_16969, partial [Ostertagia ostertagi]